jgi:hypothetical protein
VNAIEIEMTEHLAIGIGLLIMTFAMAIWSGLPGIGTEIIVMSRFAHPLELR